MSLFPVPVSGQKIPRGWFARLVRFVNSLVLRGDGSYLAVTHTPDGTFIKPTPYLIDQLAQSGRAAAGGSGTSGIQAAVSGGTASVSVSGTTPLTIAPGNANVQISSGSTGELLIGASAMVGMPDYNASSPEYIDVTENSPYIKPGGFSTAVWLIGTVGVSTASNMTGDVQLSIGSTSMFLFDLTIAQGSALGGLFIPVFLPVPANVFVQITAHDNAGASLHAYPTL